MDSLIDRINQLEQNIDNSINNVLKEAFALINTRIDSLDAKIDGMETRLKEHLNSEIAEANNFLKLELASLNNKIAVIVERVGLVENIDMDTEMRLSELERLAHRNDLIINGLPDSVTNLNSVCKNICNIIGLDPTTIDNCNLFRVKSGAVVIKFSSSYVKDLFFRSYLKFKRLNLTHIGFDSAQRIFVNESLTKQTATLLKTANKFRKDGWISNTFTKNGFLFIKKRPDDVPIKITSMNQLVTKQNNQYSPFTHNNKPATPSKFMKLINDKNILKI